LQQPITSVFLGAAYVQPGPDATGRNSCWSAREGFGIDASFIQAYTSDCARVEGSRDPPSLGSAYAMNVGLNSVTPPNGTIEVRGTFLARRASCR